MAEYLVRSWNSWHHHMALVMLADAYFIVAQDKIYEIS